jgi:hypothetical protein
MLTRHEVAYAAWYIVLFTLVVGWAAARPALHAALRAAVESENPGSENGGLDVAEHEPEMRRMTQRIAR